MDEPPSILVPPLDMLRHLGDLLSTKEGADVELLVGGESFAAHRCVLAARSPFFEAKLSLSAAAPTKNRIIQINGMEPRVFRAKLALIYTDAWPEPARRQQWRTSCSSRRRSTACRG
uniref:BTB domain-containing protein n=1 Tax=Oryza punctata TaxID=4537 RepID=A0A0E0M8Z4_ORYPU